MSSFLRPPRPSPQQQQQQSPPSSRNDEKLTLVKCVDAYGDEAEKETFVRDWYPHLRLTYLQNNTTERRVYPYNLEYQFKCAAAAVQRAGFFARGGRTFEQFLSAMNESRNVERSKNFNDLPGTIPEDFSVLNDAFRFPADSAIYSGANGLNAASGIVRNMMKAIDSQYRKTVMVNESNDVRLSKIIRYNYILTQFRDKFDLAEKSVVSVVGTPAASR